MTHHACDLCGADQPRSLPQDPRISVCGRCGFVYVPERRSSAEIAASWGEIYATGAYSPEWSAVKARLFYVADWIDQQVGPLAGKKLLDIGAGNGRFLSEAKKRGAGVFGIEPAAGNCPPEHVVSRSIEDGPLGEQFDIVTINWTLENCGDCMAMLRFAREHCKPDGWVVVATGSRLLVPFKKPLSSYLNPNIPADLHCFRWSNRSLMTAFRRVGMWRKAENLWRDSDWLVFGAARCDDMEAAPYYDDPDKVLSFFATWAEVCP